MLPTPTHMPTSASKNSVREPHCSRASLGARAGSPVLSPSAGCGETVSPSGDDCCREPASNDVGGLALGRGRPR